MDYSASWQRLLSSNCNNTSLGWSGHYTSIAAHKPSLRSIWWRLLLGVFPKDTTQWQHMLRQQRREYEEIRLKLSVTPGITEETEDLCLNNPLSQDSQWTSERCRTLVSRCAPVAVLWGDPFSLPTMSQCNLVPSQRWGWVLLPACCAQTTSRQVGPHNSPAAM